MIYLGSDHSGFALKEAVKKILQVRGETIEDCGTNSSNASDYPIFAKKVADKVSKDELAKGILFCRSGQGMAITANRYKNIRAAVAWDKMSAAESRRDNDSNILSLPVDFVSMEKAIEIIDIWLETPFSELERHRERIDQIDK